MWKEQKKNKFFWYFYLGQIVTESFWIFKELLRLIPRLVNYERKAIIKFKLDWKALLRRQRCGWLTTLSWEAIRKMTTTREGL